ncbi:hypothetical protein [Streptomyces sp. NPDC001380]|uniref:hypothetical protein n=1 Tax=Streptomyces sp. NPDC001380 TaxID=3364566 RepID=UPI0036CBA004
MVDRDASPAVLRAAVQALLPDAHRVPRARLDVWLAPGRPGRLRRHAAALLRARGSWDRLEAGLRLVHDADPGLAREALEDLRAWAAGAATGYRQVTAGQLAILGSLLDAAGGSGEDGAGGGPLDGPTVRVLRGALAAARPSG